MVIDLLELAELCESEGSAGVGNGMECCVHLSLLFLLCDNGDEEAGFCCEPEENFSDAETVERSCDEVEDGIEEEAEDTDVRKWIGVILSSSKDGAA